MPIFMINHINFFFFLRAKFSSTARFKEAIFDEKLSDFFIIATVERVLQLRLPFVFADRNDVTTRKLNKQKVLFNLDYTSRYV